MKKLNYLVEGNFLNVYFTEGTKVLNGTTKLVKEFSKYSRSKAIKGNFNIEVTSNLSDMVKSLVTFAEAQKIEIYNVSTNKQINILDLKEAPTAPAAAHGIILEEKHTNLITGETKKYKPAPGPQGELRFTIIQKNLVVIFKNEKGQKIFNNDCSFIEEFTLLTRTFPLMGKFTIREDQEKIINHLEGFAAKHNLILIDKRKPGSEDQEIKEAIKKAETKKTEVKEAPTAPEAKKEIKKAGFYVEFNNELTYFEARQEAFKNVGILKRDPENIGKEIKVIYVNAKGSKKEIYSITAAAPEAKKEVTQEEKDKDKQFKSQLKTFTDIMAIDEINKGAISELLMEIIDRVSKGQYQGINNRLILIATLFINNIDLKYLDNIHTYAAWKKRGYQVQKGEKAAAKTSLWIKKDIKKKDVEEIQQEANGEEENNNTYTKFYLKASNLFTIDQVKEA